MRGSWHAGLRSSGWGGAGAEAWGWGRRPDCCCRDLRRGVKFCQNERVLRRFCFPRGKFSCMRFLSYQVIRVWHPFILDRGPAKLVRFDRIVSSLPCASTRKPSARAITKLLRHPLGRAPRQATRKTDELRRRYQNAALRRTERAQPPSTPPECTPHGQPTP